MSSTLDRSEQGAPSTKALFITWPRPQDPQVPGPLKVPWPLLTLEATMRAEGGRRPPSDACHSLASLHTSSRTALRLLPPGRSREAGAAAA